MGRGKESWLRGVSGICGDFFVSRVSWENMEEGCEGEKDMNMKSKRVKIEEN